MRLHARERRPNGLGLDHPDRLAVHEQHIVGPPLANRHLPHGHPASSGHRRVLVVLHHPATRLQLRVDVPPSLLLGGQPAGGVVSHAPDPSGSFDLREFSRRLVFIVTALRNLAAIAQSTPNADAENWRRYAPAGDTEGSLPLQIFGQCLAVHDDELLVGAGEGGVERAMSSEVFLEVGGLYDYDPVELQAADEDGTRQAQLAP